MSQDGKSLQIILPFGFSKACAAYFLNIPIGTGNAFYQGYFIHSLGPLHYCNTPNLATRLTGDYRSRNYTGMCDPALLDTRYKKDLPLDFSNRKSLFSLLTTIRSLKLAYKLEHVVSARLAPFFCEQLQYKQHNKQNNE